uniref:Uncharacterized protein n=1 Tax=Strigamia maritima TaxID=126957 RepID=T1JDT8_STRMM
CVDNPFCTNIIQIGSSLLIAKLKQDNFNITVQNFGPLQTISLAITEASEAFPVGQVCSVFNYQNNNNSRRDDVTFEIDNFRLTGDLSFADLQNWCLIVYFCLILNTVDLVVNTTITDPCLNPNPDVIPPLPKINLNCITLNNPLGILDLNSLSKLGSGTFNVTVSKLKIHVQYVANKNANWTIITSSLPDEDKIEITDVSCMGHDDLYETMCECFIDAGLIQDLISAYALMCKIPELDLEQH